MKDKEFLTEAEALNFEVNPESGAALGRIAARVVDTPKSLAARARQFLE